MLELRGGTAALDAIVNDALGDEITYAAEEGGDTLTFNAWVDFGSEHVMSSGSAATASSPTVEIPFAQVPLSAKPTRDARITISIRPGIIWKPADIQEAPTGQAWAVTLAKAPL